MKIVKPQETRNEAISCVFLTKEVKPSISVAPFFYFLFLKFNKKSNFTKVTVEKIDIFIDEIGKVHR
jgi:hypothetical protein